MIPGYFYPRPPRGGRLAFFICYHTPSCYFYPRPPRGGRLTTLVHGIAHGQISIHALREEGDIGQRQGQTPEAISIHALREEGDSPAFNGSNDHIRFLSTPSARRATVTSSTLRRRARTFLSTPSARRATSLNGLGRSPENNFYPRPPRGGRLAGRANGWDTTLDFYPRPPRGGRPYNGHPVIRKYIISIHALREEGDDGFADAVNYFFISIHALREEGDGRASTGSRLMVNFYPRPPRGGRRTHYRREINRWRFLSTPSARRATRGSAAGAPPLAISIHALREEGDPPTRLPCHQISYFYPRPPRGGRLGMTGSTVI